MTVSYTPTASRQHLRKEQWRDRLVCSADYARCRPIQQSKEMSQCIYWDTHITTAKDPDRNRYRISSREAYFNWANIFCQSIDIDVDNALTKLSNKELCIPCLGRMVYQVLALELIAPYLGLLPTLPILHEWHVQMKLAPPTDRQSIAIRDSVRTSAIADLVAAVYETCKQKHYKELSAILNHGRSTHVPYQHMKLGYLSFKSITTNYSISLLARRAQRGSYGRAFNELTANSPKDKWGDMDFLL